MVNELSPEMSLSFRITSLKFFGLMVKSSSTKRAPATRLRCRKSKMVLTFEILQLDAVALLRERLQRSNCDERDE